MLLSLFAVLFIIGFITYLLSLKINEIDLTNTYQVQLSFLSFVLSVILVYSSFNIQVYSADVSTSVSFVDYGYVGASLALVILNLLNLIVLLIWGSYSMLFSRR